MNNIKEILSGFGDDTLREELERRRKEKELKVIPKMIEDPDFSKLRKVMQEYMDDLNDPNFHEDNDWETDIYEAAIEAFFGEGFWDWYNKKF